MVSDALYIWTGIIFLDYILLINNKPPYSRLLGELFIIFIGLAAYLIFDSSTPWGIIAATLGMMALLVDLFKLGNK